MGGFVYTEVAKSIDLRALLTACGLLRGGSNDGISRLEPRLYPQHQFANAKRLGHIVVRSNLESNHAVDFLGAGGKDDHRGLVGASRFA